jgi:hypothetical protein
MTINNPSAELNFHFQIVKVIKTSYAIFALLFLYDMYDEMLVSESI